MDLWFFIVFGVFFLGLVFIFQGIIGKDPDFLAWAPWLRPDMTAIKHEPERHRWRLVFIGLGLIVLSIVIGIIVW